MNLKRGTNVACKEKLTGGRLMVRRSLSKLIKKSSSLIDTLKVKVKDTKPTVR